MRTVLLLLSVFLMLILCMWLYQLPVKLAVYPIILCTVIALLFAINDISKEYEEYSELVRIEENINDILVDLPKTDEIISREYANIIEKILDDKKDLKEKLADDYANMVDYYTTWAHQIKTPIASMKLKLDGMDSENSRQLRRDLSRIERYVEMVLTYLELEDSCNDFVFKSSSVDKIIKEVIRGYSNDFILKKIRLKYEPVNRNILTDEKWFAFVLEQVISNALKYTNENGTISIYLDDRDRLVVEDNGMGIAKEDLPRIFEKGFTGFNGRSNKKASGIGLYLCKRICERLNSEISIESEVNKGTKVILEINREDIVLE